MRGIHWGPVNSPHKWPVMLKMFPFDDVIMCHIPHFTVQWTGASNGGLYDEAHSTTNSRALSHWPSEQHVTQGEAISIMEGHDSNTFRSHYKLKWFVGCSVSRYPVFACARSHSVLRIWMYLVSNSGLYNGSLWSNYFCKRFCLFSL